MDNDLVTFDIDRDGSGRQRDRIRIDYLAEVRSLRRLDPDDTRSERQRWLQYDLGNLKVGLEDLPSKPSPIGKDLAF